MSLSNLTAASGPSGTDIVARFHACPPSLLRAVAVHWRRPENHSTFDVLASRVRGVSITHIWKNAGTSIYEHAMHEHKSMRFSWHADFSPEGGPETARARRAVADVMRSSSYFSAAVVREPTQRLFSSVCEMIVRGHLPHMAAQPRNESHATAMTTIATAAQLMELVESFVDHELSFEFPPPGHGGGWHGHNFHSAPQVAFLSDWRGRPHRVDYLGRCDTSDQLARELGFLLGDGPNASWPAVVQRHKGVQRAELSSAALQARHQLSDALQQKICRLMRADYCCLGFELPSACVGTISCPSF